MISNNHINTQNKTPTRRDYIKYGGLVITGGLLTGCIGNNRQDSTNNKQQNDGQTSAENEYYSVTISWYIEL